MSFFHKQPAMASVMCESDSCNWWKISREDFEKFLDQNPEVKTQIAETLAKREKENKEKKEEEEKEEKEEIKVAEEKEGIEVGELIAKLAKEGGIQIIMKNVKIVINLTVKK